MLRSNATEEISSLFQTWRQKKNLPVQNNPFLEHPDEELWEMWEKLCIVAPMRFALVNVNMPSDLAQFAQVILATTQKIPHVATYLVGETLDFMYPKIRNKIMAWNIAEDLIRWIPRKPASLEDLKNQGFRLIGTSPNEGTNALNYEWNPRDIAVIGGDKGLSKKNTQLLDEMIKIPCAPEVQFLTTPTVIPILTYPTLNRRGLWD